MARLQHFIIGLLLFIVMVIGLFSFYTDEASYYNATIDPNYNASYNLINSHLDNITASGTDFGGRVQSGEGVTIGITALGVGKTMLSALTTLPLDVIKIIITFADDFAAKIGIPAWIVNVAISILMIVAAYMILSAIFRRNI